MYAIREGMKQINSVIVDTFERDVERADAHLEVEAGTTGFCEEPRAYVRISAKEGDFFARVAKDDAGKPTGVEIAVSGNPEILAIMEALHFAVEAIMETCQENEDLE